MSDDRRVHYAEDEVPMEAIDETVEEVIAAYGGTITATGDSTRSFSLPRRRGVAASGTVECVVSWSVGAGEPLGSVTLSSDQEVTVQRPQAVALLVTGVVGAVLWTLWPFFPNLGPLAWIGGALAIGAYILTLKKTPRGLIWQLLQQIVSLQIAREEEAEEG